MQIVVDTEGTKLKRVENDGENGSSPIKQLLEGVPLQDEDNNLSFSMNEDDDEG